MLKYQVEYLSGHCQADGKEATNYTNNNLLREFPELAKWETSIYDVIAFPFVRVIWDNPYGDSNKTNDASFKVATSSRSFMFLKIVNGPKRLANEWTENYTFLIVIWP